LVSNSHPVLSALGGRSEHGPYRVTKFLDAERLLEECWTLCRDEVTLLWTRRRTSQKSQLARLWDFQAKRTPQG